jgi:hypothetical protein
LITEELLVETLRGLRKFIQQWEVENTTNDEMVLDYYIDDSGGILVIEVCPCFEVIGDGVEPEWDDYFVDIGDVMNFIAKEGGEDE